MFGLEPETIAKIRSAMAEIPAIEKVLIYGSRAKGNYRAGSDIDITLFGRGLEVDNSVLPLRKKINDMVLPYMFDISIFKHIDDPNVVEHILRVGKVFYQRESESK